MGRQGITVGNLMINLSPDILYGKEGTKRDDDIEKINESIVAAGKVGLPIVEYNFYAHRAMEGYFEEMDRDRGDSGWTGFDYELVQTANQPYQTRPEEKGMKFKDLPPLPNEGAHNLDEMWKNITYFLKAVIPTAEKANVRLALHPERSARAGQPRFAADHGHGGRLEETDFDRRQPFERDHFRLRRDARDGREPDRSVPLFRVARPHQPRPFPQRDRREALRAVSTKCGSTRA